MSEQVFGFICSDDYWNRCYDVDQLLKATDEGKDVSYATSLEELERELWARYPLVDERYGVYHGGATVYKEPVFLFKGYNRNLEALGRVVRRRGSVRVVGADREDLEKLPDVVVSVTDYEHYTVTYDPKKRAERDKRRAQRAAAKKAEAVVRMADLRDAFGALYMLANAAEDPVNRRLEFVRSGYVNCPTNSTEAVVKTFLQVFEAVLDVVSLKELRATPQMQQLAGLWRGRRAASVAKYSVLPYGPELVRLLDRVAGVRAARAG